MKTTFSPIKLLVVITCALMTMNTVSVAGGTWACGFEVILVKNHEPVQFSEKTKEINGSYCKLADDTVGLLLSCSVDSTASVAATQHWEEILSSDSFVHLVAEQSWKLTLATKSTIKAREILLPLSGGKWRDYIFVKDGANVHAYCKYRPEILEKIRSIPELGFSNDSPDKDKKSN